MPKPWPYLNAVGCYELQRNLWIVHMVRSPAFRLTLCRELGFPLSKVRLKFGRRDLVDHLRLRLIGGAVPSRHLANARTFPSCPIERGPSCIGTARDVIRVTSEIHRVLRPGGKAVLVVGNSQPRRPAGTGTACLVWSSLDPTGTDPQLVSSVDESGDENVRAQRMARMNRSPGGRSKVIYVRVTKEEDRAIRRRAVKHRRSAQRFLFETALSGSARLSAERSRNNLVLLAAKKALDDEDMDLFFHLNAVALGQAPNGEVVIDPPDGLTRHEKKLDWFRVAATGFLIRNYSGLSSTW
jgi:hypothetical protein